MVLPERVQGQQHEADYRYVSERVNRKAESGQEIYAAEIARTVGECKPLKAMTVGVGAFKPQVVPEAIHYEGTCSHKEQWQEGSGERVLRVETPEEAFDARHDPGGKQRG